MLKLWPIAFITFKEGIRNKAVYGVMLLSLFLLSTNFFMAGIVIKDMGKITVDLALSSVSLAGFLIVFFVSINLMAKDLDRRTIYTILSRPVSRARYMVGKFLGMVLLLAVLLLLVSIAALLSILVFKLYFQTGSERFTWSTIMLSLFFILLSYVVLTALAFLFSSFASTSFTTLILTLISYLIGQSLEEMRTLIGISQKGLTSIPAITKDIFAAAYYLFPNLSLFDLKLQAAHGLYIPWSYALWTTAYGVIYACLALAFAALIFKRREFA